ncbi:hypothetical protein TWF281_005395 [Arthrobotrys megalospora]
MEQQHQQGVAGGGERELNPFRHVQPTPPADAGTEEFRREMLQMQRRFAPRVSDSRARALELERELNADASSLRTHHQRRSTPIPQPPGLRAVIVPPARPIQHQRSGSFASDPLELMELRLLSPEPASVALPLSPTSAEASRFQSLSSPTGETFVPGPGAATPEHRRGVAVTSPGFTSGQITPPTRPTPPPTAPRRVKRVYPHQASRTPDPFRLGIQARESGAPRTAPPRPPVTYSQVGQDSQRQGHSGPTTQQRGSRRISPTFVSPLVARSSTSPFMVDIRPTAGPTEEPDPLTILGSTMLSVSGLLSSSSTPRDRSLTTLPTPRNPDHTARAVPPRAMPVTVTVPEQTPFPGMRTAHSIQDTLRKVGADTPKGNSERTTPAESTVIRKSVPPSRLTEYLPEESPGSHQEPSVADFGTYDRNLQDGSPLGRKGPKVGHTKGNEKSTGWVNPATKREGRAESQKSVQFDQNQLGDQQATDPQTFHPGLTSSASAPRNVSGILKMSDTRERTLLHAPSRATLDEILDSLESLRGAAKRLESMMKDYRANLKVDAKELKRSRETSADLQSELTENHRYHTDRVEALLRNLRKKQNIYRDNLGSLHDLADDPVLDPVVGISNMDEKDELKQRIAFRGRLLIRDTLKKLGYKGGPVRPFLEQLDHQVWKMELTQAIIATDPGISQAIRLLHQHSNKKLKRGSEIEFHGVDLKDLSSLPWGSFKVKKLEDVGEDEIDNAAENPGPSLQRGNKGKGKATIHGDLHTEISTEGSATQVEGRESTPILPESGDEEEAEYDRSFMTDSGMTPRLKSKLNRLEQREKWERIGRGRQQFARR